MKKCVVLLALAAAIPLAGCVAPYPYYRYGYYDGYRYAPYAGYDNRYGYGRGDTYYGYGDDRYESAPYAYYGYHYYHGYD